MWPYRLPPASLLIPPSIIHVNTHTTYTSASHIPQQASCLAEVIRKKDSDLYLVAANDPLQSDHHLQQSQGAILVACPESSSTAQAGSVIVSSLSFSLACGGKKTA